MGSIKGRWFGRAVSRTLLLLLVAMVAAMAGAVPGSPAEAASKKKTPGDPPGNNGTVKIEQESEGDEDLGNEPHGDDCRIWLEFYGFDAGQQADITFEAHPPTKSTDGKPLITDHKNISGDQAGGGPNDPEPPEESGELTYGYNFTDVLGGITPHEKQGYHIKLTILVQDKDGKEVPGATKHKVFWLAPCKVQPPPPQETASTASTLRISKEQVGTGQGPFKFSLVCDHSPLNREFELKAGEKLDITDVPPGTTCKVTETDKKGADATITEDPVTGEANDGEVKTVSDKATIVKFKNKFAGDQVIAPPPDTDLRPGGGGGSPGTSVEGTNAAKNPGTDVLGATETAPDATATLPRTGSDPRPLTAAGLWTLAAGGMALLAGRRPRRP